MLWWQPILVAFPEPSIHNDWGEVVDQLNTYFGQPDLAQASKCTLRTLKMQDYQHVNKYMIEFSEHATHTGWNDAALYGEFYQGLAERIKDQLLSLDRPQMFQQLKADTLKCDTHHWECQGEKSAPYGWNRQSAFATTSSKTETTSTTSTDPPKVVHNNFADAKLMDAERERRRLKGLCYYCPLPMDAPAPDCQNPRHPKAQTVGRATFAITDGAEVTITEVVAGPPTVPEN